MPAVEDYRPQNHPKSLANRKNRAERMSRYLSLTEPVRIACRVRRETRHAEGLLDQAFALGLAALPDILELMSALDRHRARMLDILGAPKRPGRAVVSEKLAREIRDSIPAEIEVPENPIEPPPVV